MDKKPMVLYDGYCVLCNRLVRFVIRKDKQVKILFGSLDSDAVSEVLNKVNFYYPGIDSVVLIYRDEAFIKSEAVFKILEILGGKWKVLLLFKILPKKFLDWAYDSLAGKRYDLFGKFENCPIPDRNQEAHFIS